MKILKSSLPLMLAASSFTVQAAKPLTPPAGGKAISSELIGIFFEDISHAADGGLYAELLQNGSFEFNANERDGWGPATAWRVIRPGHSLGQIQTLQADPLHRNNPNYMRLTTERVGHYYDFNGWTGYGLENRGFDGITVKGGAKYDFSVFTRCPDGKEKQVRVVLVAPGKEQTVIADTTLTVGGTTWSKNVCTLTANADCKDAMLRFLVMTPGTMDVDMLSLMPQDTYKGHGMRRDLAEALEALNPKFMRFPGGCVVHGGGDGFWNTYHWKNTIGPKEQRVQMKNTWGYHQSMGLGYYEYFQLCEDMNMEPLPILPCGVSCQGANGGWGMKGQAQDACPMSDMDRWTQDALDLIEWANGSVDTKWGRIRAEQGHPKPFGLKYLGIGNEEKISPEFAERFKYMYERITKAHPEIVIVGTAGPGSHPGNPDFDNGWKIAEELGMPILDEHYYEQRGYFETSRQYDAYPRDRKTKVYLGEYAAKDKKMADALAEALYLCHVERNGDVVAMTSYAPLFARKGATNWNPDLIYFDNERPYLTCSYYVQQMFGQSAGDYFYGDCVKFDGEKTNMQEQSVVLNTKTRQLFVKICNASGDARKVTVDLSRFKGMKSVGKLTTLAGSPDAENNYEAQPIAPVTETVKVKRKMSVDLKPHSFVMYTINL
ncbi:MAG: alpha-L-arabinofuranosidase C-terminal domain-containing protein [Prevotellaceae bacterium]|nr:alpha-L-arabinofuranosidase C-terminal domain-containing protein [Prevotellaceae bacterium]MDO4932049.1 alpha-L-arabinofuranosidase C-terminal domain-containing protein [Prevotellaceae bacterium]